MKRLLFTTVTVLALTAQAWAFYTECSVTKETTLSIRPNGPTEPRYMPVKKGDKVAYRNSYRDWWFVMHADGDKTDYGWLPQNVLANCQKMEGTP